MRRAWETFYPFLVAVVIVAIGHHVFKAPAFTTSRPFFIAGCVKLFPSALNISAISVGFLATSLSLLVSLSGSHVVKELKASGHYVRLISFFMSAIYISSSWALMSGWLTTIDFNHQAPWRLDALWVWCYLGVCSVISYARATGILKQVLNIETNKPLESIAATAFRVDNEH